MEPGLILQHEESGPPALFAEWCERRGIAYEIRRVWEDGLPDAPDGLPWICALGSEHSPAEQDAPSQGQTVRVNAAAGKTDDDIAIGDGTPVQHAIEGHGADRRADQVKAQTPAVAPDQLGHDG